MHVSLFTNVGKSQIKETETHFNIEGVPITVDDAVMNGILYSAEHNKKGMPSIRDRVVTLSHPTTNDGQGADAYAGESLQKFYSGGHIETVYADNGVWRVNISIDKQILRVQDERQNSNFYDRLANKEDIGVSTGLFTRIEESPGTNAAGDEYRGIATEQNYNHLAMLENSETPAGGESTFMRFNTKEHSESFIVNLADYMPPDPDKEEESKVEVEIEKDDMEGFLTKLMAMLGVAGLIKGNKTETNQPTEVNAMSDIKNMVDALKKANMYKDNMSDDDVKNAYDKMMKEKKDAPSSDEKKDNAQNSELIEAINALREEVDGLKSQLNAKDKAEKDALIAEVNELDTGIEEADLQGMSINSLQALKDKHTSVTNSVSGQFRQQQKTNADDEFADVAG